jgi:hypothetical protein
VSAPHVVSAPEQARNDDSFNLPELVDDVDDETQDSKKPKAVTKAQIGRQAEEVPTLVAGADDGFDSEDSDSEEGGERASWVPPSSATHAAPKPSGNPTQAPAVPKQSQPPQPQHKGTADPKKEERRKRQLQEYLEKQKADSARRRQELEEQRKRRELEAAKAKAQAQWNMENMDDDSTYFEYAGVD